MKIQILLPTLNENSNIEPLIRRIFEVAPGARALVIDDDSTDGTPSTVERLLPEFPQLDLLVRRGPKGLGRAYLAGIERSIDSADALITMDADFSHDPSDLPRLMEAGETHDLVIGSRYAPGGGVNRWESWRRALSRGGNLYCRAITKMPVNDATSGFQLFRTEALKRMRYDDITASGYAFQIELKHRLWRSGATVTELPIVFHARRGGESKLTSHIVWEGVLTPWRLRMEARLCYSGKVVKSPGHP